MLKKLNKCQKRQINNENFLLTKSFRCIFVSDFEKVEEK